MTNSPN